MILIQALLVWSVLRLVKNSVYLYNTEDSSSLEMYDCIFHKSWYYCRRPIGPMPLQRNNIAWQCHHNGIRHTFVNMKSKNITASIVTQKWSSSAEMAEKYARYMGKSVNSDRDHEQYICECKHPRSFGKYCEYFLPSGITFSETLEWEGKMKNENEWKMQLYGDILCYTTLPCNSGLLCLDWRDICDGAQQCMSGYDEENCDKLEFNECEDDEYRCMNGMCIPDEYFLDGEHDCMDLTDEIGIFNDAFCTFQAVSSECDDRVCHPNQWSCGDGQCIKDRLAFQKEKPMSDECRNRREQYYMCETHYSLRLWTLPHGKCVNFNDDEESNVQNRTSIHKCEYFVKCALLRGLENNCLCQHNLSCSNKLENPCPLSTIQYPNGGILAPYAFHFYNTTRHWDTSTPDFIVINSTIKCRGYMSIQLKTIPYRLEFPTRIIEDSLCNYLSNSYALDNTGYDRFCYNDSRTFNNRSYYFIDVCNISRECISAYRIQDGYENCVDRQDENRHDIVANTCSKLKRHRFQCSAQEPHCLSVNKLGDLWDDCKNKYDESWMGTETMLSKMKCNSKSKDDCLYIRQYIEASWNVGNDSGVSLNPAKKIPFRAYCDTFWDFLSKADENTSMCRTWSVCLDEQWRCRTGQCINPKWVLDGEWDCSDASDEEGIFVSNHSLLPRNLKLIKRSELEEKISMFSDQYVFSFRQH
ncbi:unnamed protein product [Adineta steineri]|uniref:Uncharacterized protein n=1 Tax=Adineta steineri TaxID=433720 RepID=A0A814Y1S0_9BILA|nr:unnamed protein product [Adineta steineri]CAF3697179.1 unnamed protein product [Adineta steineri]